MFLIVFKTIVIYYEKRIPPGMIGKIFRGRGGFNHYAYFFFQESLISFDFCESYLGMLSPYVTGLMPNCPAFAHI